MFSTEEFQQWAKSGKAVLFASVMTKIEGREDDDLLRTYGFRGFPSLAILDPDGEMITSSIDRSLASMAQRAENAMAYAKLEQAAADGDADPVAWYLARLRMGVLDLETAKADREGLSFTAEQTREVANGVFALDVADLRTKAFGRGGTDEDRDAARTTIYEAFKSGLRLDESSRDHGLYVDAVVEKAKEEGNAEAFLEVAPHAVKNVEASIANMEQAVQRYEQVLEDGASDEMKPRYEQAIERAKASIEQQKERITELRATIAEMKEKQGD